MVARGVDPAARRRSLEWAQLTATTIVASTLIDWNGARSAPTPWSYVAWLAAGQGPVMTGVVALVAALRETSVLFALLIARGPLRERIGAMR